MKSRLVLLGPPASGKGTQAEMISEQLQIPTTSTGAILRREARSGSVAELSAERVISQGGLAPDDLVLDLVAAWLSEHPQKFLFDGFPRTIRQAQSLDRLLRKTGNALERAVFLDLPDATIRRRMAKRLTCSRCGKIVSVGRHVGSVHDACPNCGGKLEIRSDDNDLALERRLQDYRSQTLPVTEFYRSAGLLAEVDADREVDTVFQDLRRVIDGR